MYRDIFQVTNPEPYATWAKAENGKEAPVKELWLKCVTKDPAVDEVICTVYGVDAIQHYNYGDYVIATIDIFVGMNEDETYKQEIRAKDIKKFDVPQDS